jgi:hypothetical protein
MAHKIMGKMVKDKISGYEGIVVARTEWLHGCVRLTVQAQELEKGLPVNNCCFDEPQLEVIGDGISVAVAAGGVEKPVHGDRDDPNRDDQNVTR